MLASYADRRTRGAFNSLQSPEPTARQVLWEIMRQPEGPVLLSGEWSTVICPPTCVSSDSGGLLGDLANC